jgi:hypothetical protein
VSALLLLPFMSADFVTLSEVQHALRQPTPVKLRFMCASGTDGD